MALLFSELLPARNERSFVSMFITLRIRGGTCTPECLEKSVGSQAQYSEEVLTLLHSIYPSKNSTQKTQFGFQGPEVVNIFIRSFTKFCLFKFSGP